MDGFFFRLNGFSNWNFQITKKVNKKIQHCFVQGNLETLFEVIPVVS